MERIVEIDNSQHKIILGIELILFNLVLVFALITISLVIKVWYVYLISSILFVLCITYSIVVFVKNKKLNVYKLTDEYIYIKNTLIEVKINYNEIIKIAPKKSFVDSLTHRDKQTLILYTTRKNYEKIKLYFIKENTLNLADEIISKKLNDAKEINLKNIVK